MKRPFDDLVGHMRTVKIARIDVVDPDRDNLSQNSYGSLSISGWSPHLRAGKLHRAIAHSLQAHGSAGKREAGAKVNLFRHSVSPLLWLDEESFNRGDSHLA